MLTVSVNRSSVLCLADASNLERTSCLVAVDKQAERVQLGNPVLLDNQAPRDNAVLLGSPALPDTQERNQEPKLREVPSRR